MRDREDAKAADAERFLPAWLNWIGTSGGVPLTRDAFLGAYPEHEQQVQNWSFVTGYSR